MHTQSTYINVAYPINSQ